MTNKKTPQFSEFSKNNLSTCHEKLQLIFNLVINEYDCRVLCGFRNKEEQNKAYTNGYSTLKWPKSRHNTFPSMAVDVVPYPVDWDNTDRFIELSKIVKRIANELEINIQWGGDWKTFKDFPHWELL